MGLLLLRNYTNMNVCLWMLACGGLLLLHAAVAHDEAGSKISMGGMLGSSSAIIRFRFRLVEVPLTDSTLAVNDRVANAWNAAGQTTDRIPAGCLPDDIEAATRCEVWRVVQCEKRTSCNQVSPGRVTNGRLCVCVFVLAPRSPVSNWCPNLTP